MGNLELKALIADYYGFLDDELKGDVEKLLAILEFLRLNARPHSSSCLNRFKHQVRESSFQNRLITAPSKERREINARQIHARAHVTRAVLDHFAAVRAFNLRIEDLEALVKKILDRLDELSGELRKLIAAKCMLATGLLVEHRELDNPQDSLRVLQQFPAVSNVHMFESLRLIFTGEVEYTPWPYPLKFITLNGGTGALSDAFTAFVEAKALLEATTRETRSQANRPHVMGIIRKLERSILDDDTEAYNEAACEIASANLKANHDLVYLEKHLAEARERMETLSKTKDTVAERLAAIYNRPSSLVGYGDQVYHAIDMVNCVMARKELKDSGETIARAASLLDEVHRIYLFNLEDYFVSQK